ncbi:putative lipoprotein [Treponema primitia ZAS-2]|uniref:Putative lipoprotein n=1 Tax=Treponema primitia (strain ATCC BAA-887 / DSM 12427 / ZAS-2) TaxID=545694 RepID=F5YQL7_TREPZ|nr:hypothetical protein [Treponema primitia]AEF85353.1 putative lipoprotein [Treponema primitia ZAS-2]
MKWLLALLPVLMILGCESLVTDLPKTDIPLYQISGGYKFPENTPTIDIYNCLVGHGLNFGTEISATGTYAITRSSKLNGNLYTDTKTRNVLSVSIKHLELDPDINDHIAIFTFDDNSKLEIHFKWQRQTTNVWQNDKIEGKLTITL